MKTKSKQVPRYISSSPIQFEFTTNPEGCGEYLFTQLKMANGVYLYQRHRISDPSVVEFEVFIPKQVKAGTPLPGGAFVEANYEQYPKASAFGKTALFCVTEELANQAFDRLLAKQAAKLEGDVENPSVQPIIPDGEFTHSDFADANNLPKAGPSYLLLQESIKSNTVVATGFQPLGRGRPTKMYKKA